MPTRITFTIEQSIIHHLMLKTIRLESLGLLYGKLGIAIAFFEYGKHTQDSIYTDHAEDLIDGLLSKIDNRTTYDFATGLSGIGWGVEYLIQNHFVECNSNEACKDIDDRLMAVDIRRMQDISLETGLEGILHYVLARITGASNQKNRIPFDELYLYDLHKKLNTIQYEKRSYILNALINQFTNIFQKKHKPKYILDIKPLLNDFKLQEKEIIHAKLGLKEGVAGSLLKLIASNTH